MSLLTPHQSPSSLSFYMFGHFGLTKPNPISPDKPNVSYSFTDYNTILTSIAGPDKLKCTLRAFSDNKSHFPPYTICFALVKVYIPPPSSPSKVSLNSVFCAPANNGSPFSDDNGPSLLPQLNIPLAFVIGHIVKGLFDHQVPGKSSFRAIVVSTSSFFNGSTQESLVTCVFHNKTRWKKIPVLNIGSCFSFTGFLYSFDSSSNEISFTVEDISVNLNPISSDDARLKLDRQSGLSAVGSSVSIGVKRSFVFDDSDDEDSSSVPCPPSSISSFPGMAPALNLSPSTSSTVASSFPSGSSSFPSGTSLTTPSPTIPVPVDNPLISTTPVPAFSNSIHSTSIPYHDFPPSDSAAESSQGSSAVSLGKRSASSKIVIAAAKKKK
ncbi:hypothetical protein CVT24_003657 [Panaeolus cyanescens]|uniref:Uncharacterized protein n=1 Tax=Panaeolus cyanescens TaxID=181874 RepID=A0A409X3Y0_9AGAR|nr:hypothetical protein CVT24_003657 [Panaeolus cyanescens]